MKSFWKKKLPSLLLALLMMVSLVPAAAAAGADVTYTVAPGGKITFDISDFSALKSFEYLEFTGYSKLDDFGKLTAYDKDGDKVTLAEKDLDALWFYYDEDNIDYDSDCDLDTLTFVADSGVSGTLTLTFELWKDGAKKYTGTLDINIGNAGSSSSSANIVYTLDEDDEVSFKPSDFKAYFNKSYTGTPKYVRFTNISNLDESGALTTYIYDNDEWEAVTLDENEALDGYFYYSDDDVEDKADNYCLDGLGFESDKNTDGEVVTLAFTIYGTTSTKKVNGTLRIEIGDVKNTSGSTAKEADIKYTAKAEEEVEFDEDDFNDFFRESYGNYDFKYLYFTDSENLSSSNGYLYYKYDRSSEVRFTASTLDDAFFYYDEDDIPEDEEGSYSLDDISFVAGKDFSKPVTLAFTAQYSSSKKVSGTVTISPEGTASGSTSSNLAANVLYTTTSGTNVQLKATDFARFYESAVPNSTLKSVKLLAVPSAGGLYYNYYGKSAYGTAARLQLTASNCTGLTLYSSPSDTTDYSLTELTYVPASTATNYTASIPFTATGTGNHSVSGLVMISVTSKAVPEVYGVTPKNTAVSFPAPAISSAVKSGTSATLAEIQLLELPASKVGTVYVGTGTSRKANISDLYGVSGSTWTISQLRFVPATGYTGNVKIPYLAYDTNGKAIGVGTFSLGIVSKQVSFRDVSSSTWCYKYVAELSDAGVISGYTDGTFKPNNTITYGAALKLIMLAAGYSEQAPTVKGSTFSGYLDKARAEGIITRSNVNLSGPITRLQVAQLAAGAMKLDLDNLSSVAPFTDTTDKSVQALNEAGIVEGYFSNGTSTYKPGNTLTRGQVSAIVWRMQNYQ